jgi:type IV pilus assembly protein PilB
MSTNPATEKLGGEAPADAGKQHHFLQRIQLFSQLSWAECEEVVKRLKRKEFPPNQVIVREGQPGSSMFFITAGKVEVRKKDPNTAIDFLLSELGPGQSFGEMALLTEQPRSATVVAVEPTTVGVLEQNDFQGLLLSQPKIGVSLTRILAQRLNEANQQVGIEYIQLGRLQFDERVLTLLPQSMMTQHRVLPVSFNNNRLTLAMVDPNNLMALDDVRRVIKGVMIEPVVCTEEDFKKFMSSTYQQILAKTQKKPVAPPQRPLEPMVVKATDKSAGAPLDAEAVLAQLQTAGLDNIDTEGDEAPTEQKASATELTAAADEGPIVRLANAILGLAIQRGASDIHIEPREKELQVRLRIDGLLQPVQTLTKKVQMGLISRLKILSRLDIAEKRMPQDGRISVKVEDRLIDFRVSTIPTKWGEKVCLRLLDKSNTALGLDKLISDAATLAKVREMIAQPYGIIYVTGPTGSGKTTTLYSALAELNDPDVNISTVEDPVEYDLPGANQVQVQKEIELDFARVLRAFLRQDPDIILVGETRDTETAKIAVEAALTGHMVFTTLHTNDAAGTFTRLREMRIEPFLVSSSTIGVIAQRLARRLCGTCKESYEPDAEARRYWGIAEGQPVKFYKAKGCSACSGSGYKGRVGIYEVMRMSPTLRQMVVRGENADAIREAAEKEAMLTLKNYGVGLMREGHTSPEEVLQCVVVQQ